MHRVNGTAVNVLRAAVVGKQNTNKEKARTFRRLARANAMECCGAGCIFITENADGTIKTLAGGSIVPASLIKEAGLDVNRLTSHSPDIDQDERTARVAHLHGCACTECEGQHGPALHLNGCTCPECLQLCFAM